MPKKKDKPPALPRNYLAVSRQRQTLLAKLRPGDKGLGEMQLANARTIFLASDEALWASKEDLPLKSKIFVDEFMQGIMSGLAPAAVCERLQVSRSLYTHWMLAASKNEEPYFTFAQSVIAAEAEYELILLDNLKKAHGSDWRRYQFLLAAHRPERWSDAALKARAQREFEVPKEDSADADTIKVQVFNVALPDNGRDGLDTIDVTPSDVEKYRKDAKEG